MAEIKTRRLGLLVSGVAGTYGLGYGYQQYRTHYQEQFRVNVWDGVIQSRLYPSLLAVIVSRSLALISLFRRNMTSLGDVF